MKTNEMTPQQRDMWLQITHRQDQAKRRRDELQEQYDKLGKELSDANKEYERLSDREFRIRVYGTELVKSTDWQI